MPRHSVLGCRSMRTIIHTDARRHIQYSAGKNRFMCAETPDLLRIFVHLPPVNNCEESDTLRNQCLLDIAHRIRRRTRHQDVVIQGDWNVDWLPVQATDPCPGPERAQKHAEERDKLLAWAGALGLELILPSATLQPRDDLEEMLQAPISKLNFSGERFALLDYTFASPGIVKESWLIWHPELSDHAVLYNSILPRRKIPWKRKKTKWRPRKGCDLDQTLQGLRIPKGMPLQQLDNMSDRTIDAVQDKRPCAERSQARIPDEVRLIHQQIKQATGHEKKELRQRGRALLNAHRVALHRHRLTELARKGKSVAKFNKLTEISGVCIPPCKTPEEDRRVWLCAVSNFFENKWGCNDTEHLAKIENFINTHATGSLQFEQDEAFAACGRMNKTLRRHRNGTCGEFYKRLAFCNDGYVSWLTDWCNDPSNWASQFVIEGYLKSKEGGLCSAAQMRAILPLSPLGQHLDILLAERLKAAIDAVLPMHRGTHAGATGGKQAADIPTAIQLAFEKAQDAGIPAAAAQCDIHQHYDTFDTLAICEWLINHDIDPCLVATCLAFQTTSTIQLAIRGETIVIGARCKGGLTGSRCAGQLGRIPVEASIAKVHSQTKDIGLPLFINFASAEAHRPKDVLTEWEPYVRLSLASYVDNVVALGKSAKDAVSLIQHFEAEINNTWRQKIKDGSKELVVARGGTIKGINISDWKLEPNFQILGIIVQDNGETDQTWQLVRSAAFAIYFKIARITDWTSLALPHRLRELDTHILPFLSYKLASTPLTATRIYQIQKLQRAMVLGALRLKLPQELSTLERQKRRHAAASNWIFQQPWHAKISALHLNYDSHIRRSAWRHNWAGLTLLHSDPALQTFRARTGRLFRMFRGHVAQR